MTFSYLINRTVKGLNKEFYLHHFWCICFAPLFILYFSWWDGTSFLSFKDEITQKSLYQSFVAVVLWVLYPYARFAYLSILEYTGLYTIANFLTAVTIGIFNLVSMVLCYSFEANLRPNGAKSEGSLRPFQGTLSLYPVLCSIWLTFVNL